MPYIEIENDEDNGPQPTYTQLRGKFAGAANALQESEPDPVYAKPHEVPRRWQVGDLLKTRSFGRCLIVRKNVGVYHSYDVIAENGTQFQMPEPYGFQHNTGLEYSYRGVSQVAADYLAGIFTPYFEIL